MMDSLLDQSAIHSILQERLTSQAMGANDSDQVNAR